MSRCSTCKHWRAPEHDGHTELVCSPIDTDGDWLPMPMPFEVRRCASPKLQMFERPLTPDAASVVDGSNYRAALVTGPDFGCVHHEAADA